MITPLLQSLISREGNQKPATKYKTFLESRPREAENQAIELVIRLAREFGNRVHVVHHSSADALPLIAEAKADGVKITAETCPHFLSFTAEEFTEAQPSSSVVLRFVSVRIASSYGTRWRMNDRYDCFRPLAMSTGNEVRETGDFLRAWGGIFSLELRLPAVWTEAQKRGFSIQDLSRWLCREPARLVGLHAKKGSIAPGYDADLVIWKPNRQFQVEAPVSNIDIS